MLSSLIRTLTFFNKWLADVVREPALLASLVLGPFLILLLFGAGAKVGAAPKPRAIIVEPEGQRAGSGLAFSAAQLRRNGAKAAAWSSSAQPCSASNNSGCK